MARKLDNYLRMYRRRSGLSQDEVASLLGAGSGTLVSRYERGRRRPNFETALAYQAIFGVPARELFGGIFESVEREVRKRAHRLARTLSAAAPRPHSMRALDLLSRISAGPAYGPAKNP